MKGGDRIRTGTASYLKRIKQYWDMYLILLPSLILLVLFKYTPMWGIRIAFQDFNIFNANGSPYVGFANFAKLFTSKDFYMILKNTLLISVYKIVVLFPLGVFIALVLNEIRSTAFKRAAQTIIYIPHFFSWIVVAGIFFTFLSSSGMVNQLFNALGAGSVNFLSSPKLFRSVLVFSAGWKELGWNAIVFLAAIAGIDQELYEAAELDGAGRLRQIVNITLPGILSTIVLMFILRIGNLLEAGTEQILAMYNPVVYGVSDVIGTYVYRVGLGQMDYSFTTAVGLFNSTVGFLFVIIGNFLSRRTTGKGIW